MKKKCSGEIPFRAIMSHFGNRSLFMRTYPFSSMAEVDRILSGNLQRFIVKLVTVSSLISPLLFDLQKKSSVSLVPVSTHVSTPIILKQGTCRIYICRSKSDRTNTRLVTRIGQVTRISQLSPCHLRLFRLV